MNEQEFLESLHRLLEAVSYGDHDDWDGEPVRTVKTFEDAGMLTRNRGLVVNLEDGSQFQLTIVQSR